MEVRLALVALALLFGASPHSLFAQHAATPPATPLLSPDAARFAFDEIGLYGVGYAYRGQAEQNFPVGWSGGFEERTGVALQPMGEQNGRPAFLLHPPWRGGTGIAFQEFRLRLPARGVARKITLRGATAMRTDAVAAPGEPVKSDGATFRVRVNGRALLDEHRADATWKPFEFDLSAFAGQIVMVRFETDSGPQDNASFDFALWSGRELVLSGFAPPTTKQLAPPPLDITRLYSVANGSVAPPSGFSGQVSTALQNGRAILSYRGADGLLQYEWTRPRTMADSPLGRWQLRAQAGGSGHANVVPLAGSARLEWTQAATFQNSRWETSPRGITCVSIFQVGGKRAIVRCTATMAGKSLLLDVRCDSPQIAAFDAGRWGPTLRRRGVVVPYYSGQVDYLAKENLFTNAFLDWTTSAASYHENTRAVYGARTDGTRVPMHERVVFCAAWHAAETLPNIPNPPSPFRARLGSKIVLDVWGGNFADIARNLQTLHDYGLNNCAVIVHDWQRSGYDNALPAHVPANARLGGDADMKTLVATAKRLGFLIALHENYVDYYPNYERFDPADIALDSQGQQVFAWFNPGPKLQSFAVKPNAIARLAGEQSAQIRARYAPNADYLDVHSAVPPWFHVDFRAGEEGAGTFAQVWKAHRALWEFERRTYNGPVLGEGAAHWYWSGLLDGVEAQFGTGWPSNAGQSAPLALDFDLLKVHPLQFNHGMGYYERWWNAPTWSGLPPMSVLDQYRMQELLYGHAGFLGGATYANVPLAWLEHHLVTPVSARYATARPVSVRYQVNGAWTDGTQAAKANQWTRARVTYDNGLTITANSDPKPLRAAGALLPQYGWIAQGAGVDAWTALRNGVWADFAQTSTSTFANARPKSDWNQSGQRHVRPSVSEFHQTGNRAFSLSYAWRAEETFSDDVSCFVHFVGGKSGDDIVFQDDHALPRPSSTWKIGETVTDGPRPISLPEALPDGDYGVRIGLLDKSGARVSLQGRSDGSGRIQLGTLHVRDAGRTLSFEPTPPFEDQQQLLYDQHLNARGTIVDFGSVRTNGSVLVRRENNEWVLRALPRAGNFSVELSAARFGRPTRVRCVNTATPAVAAQSRGTFWSLRLNGAREYRWK